MISQWADVTSLHGVSEIKGSYKHQRKFTFLFWLTTLLVMLGLLAWQTYYLVTDFISGTGYSTTIYYEDVGSFSMPQVVICNYNRANKTSADAIQMNSSHLSYFFSGFMTNYLFNSNDTQLTELQLQFEDFVTKFPQYRDSNSLMNTLAHTCNETILTCLNGSTGWNDDCCNSKVTKTVHNLYGSCLSVNKSDVVQYTPGPSNGIRILINPHSELYQSNVMWNNYLGEGIVVIVTLDDHFANPVNPIHVAPGSHAMIQLSRTRFDFEIGSFSIFPSPCIQNVGLVTLQGQYSNDSCRFDCLGSAIKSLCGCILMGVDPKTSSGTPMCTSSGSMCARTLQANSSMNASVIAAYGNYTNCKASCGASCTSRQDISSAVSITKFPSDASNKNLLDMIAKQKNLDLADNNLILLDIYHSSMGTLVINTHQTQSIFTLVGGVGGQLGLWVGASVITAIQAFYYCLYGCLVALENRKKKRSPKLEDFTVQPRPISY